MAEQKIDVMTEDRPSEATVDQLQRLIDLALKKGKSRSWTLDEVCELGGYPSSTLRGDDFILCGITHFTQEAAKKLEEKIAALPDLSAPTFEDQKALAARALELGFTAEEYSDFMREFWPDQSVPLTWSQHDAAKDAIESRLTAEDKEFYEEELEGCDAEEQLDKLFEREAERQKQEKEIEEKQNKALDELGFGDPKAPPAESVSADPSVKIADLTGSESNNTTADHASIIKPSSAATAESASSTSTSGSESIQEENQTEPSSESSKTGSSKSSKSGRKKTASSKESNGSKEGSAKRSAEGELEYGFTDDPNDFVFNSFRIHKIDLALVEINTKLEERRNPIRFTAERGSPPTFGMRFEQATQEQIDEAVGMIPESLKTDLSRACKHVLTAVSAITRKQAEIELLTRNYEALKKELEEERAAIEACYGAEIHEWALRQLDKKRKPDGSLRTKTIKTIAGVLSFTKSGGRKIDEKELIASILEKPEEERALFPIKSEISHWLDIEEMKTSGLLDVWQELGLRGVNDFPENEIGNFKISAKPRGGEE